MSRFRACTTDVLIMHRTHPFTFSSFVSLDVRTFYYFCYGSKAMERGKLEAHGGVVLASWEALAVQRLQKTQIRRQRVPASLSRPFEFDLGWLWAAQCGDNSLAGMMRGGGLQGRGCSHGGRPCLVAVGAGRVPTAVICGWLGWALSLLCCYMYGLR
uniref:Uncharacterized protein n=1 Tax=Triticum urartu TaxID=4572 RepID=A0A8R7TP95_TRIUA